ncbi:hypothetical protein FE246_08300 [Aliarcobacter thereius]|uniref:Uncharacterized protein n=2 Tax=Aliarcobacter TaxID=2321111 RepID=A0A5R9GYY4_9BACT|nr:hypothetical protein [Aliarcobacter thereius]TLS70959.1 hypothetical protein FE246_08300 [Aliarcobacter thereius]
MKDKLLSLFKDIGVLVFATLFILDGLYDTRIFQKGSNTDMNILKIYVGIIIYLVVISSWLIKIYKKYFKHKVNNKLEEVEKSEFFKKKVRICDKFIGFSIFMLLAYFYLDILILGIIAFLLFFIYLTCIFKNRERNI